MKKFKFTLESALKWKRSQEEAALKAFGEATRRRLAALDSLESSRRQLGALLEAMRVSRQAKVEAWAQNAYIREVSHQQGVCRHFEEQLAHLTAEESKAREAYLVKRREMETLVRLREKRYSLYQKESALAIEKELEEIVLSGVKTYGAT